jgi:hypothetical protein
MQVAKRRNRDIRNEFLCFYPFLNRCAVEKRRVEELPLLSSQTQTPERGLLYSSPSCFLRVVEGPLQKVSLFPVEIDPSCFPRGRKHRGFFLSVVC